MDTKIDHLVIGANSLSEGVTYIKEQLGVEVPFGGVHEKMATHNHLMRLGNEIFIEIIAIHDSMNRPHRPRWFGLDDPFVRQRISDEPCLLAWVVNTGDLKNLLKQTTFSFGSAQLLSRGDLRWYFGLPEDGRLLAGGTVPYAIQWLTDHHPALNMPDRGYVFHSLQIFHPCPQWLESVLSSIHASRLVEIRALPENKPPYMVAHINTPFGLRKLSSRRQEQSPAYTQE